MVELYEEEIAVLSLLVGQEINESGRADIQGYMLDYRLFLDFLHEKLLSSLCNEEMDDGRSGRVRKW